MAAGPESRFWLVKVLVRYEHIQTAPLYLLLVAVGVGMLGALQNKTIFTAATEVSHAGALMFLLAASFRQFIGQSVSPGTSLTTPVGRGAAASRPASR